MLRPAGITGNARALSRFLHEVERAWRYWLNRRSARAKMVWERLRRLLQHYPLPPIRIVHSVYVRQLGQKPLETARPKTCRAAVSDCGTVSLRTLRR
jgi:hypothetical protein